MTDPLEEPMIMRTVMDITINGAPIPLGTRFRIVDTYTDGVTTCYVSSENYIFLLYELEPISALELLAGASD